MSFFNELKRRNVFRVGIAYLVLGWVLLQVADIVVPIIGVPDWSMKLILILLVLGFPVALLFSWAFEITPEGIKKEKHVDRSESVTDQTARKLDVVVIVLLVAAIGLFAVDRFGRTPDQADESMAADVDVSQDLDTRASIAVLPFVNMSSSEENEYFSDGLTETLLHMLAQVKDLRVAARTSSFAFKGTNPDISEVAAQLNVKTILEGSVQRAGQRVRITAQLIDANDGSHIWSQNFDRELDDIFAIQDEIANAVASALTVSLLGESNASAGTGLIESVGTTNTEAYDLYLRALQQYNIQSYGSLPKAEQLFKQAITVDPGFEEARYDLVQTYFTMSGTGLIPPREAANRGRGVVAALLAESPVPLKAQIYAAMLDIFGAQFQVEDTAWENVESLLLRAIALSPNDVGLYQWAASVIGNAFSLDRPEEGLQFLERGLAIDPLNVDLLQIKAGILRNSLNRLDETLQVYARMREIAPQSPHGYFGAGFVYQARGEYSQAALWNFRSGQIDQQDHEIPASVAQDLLDMNVVAEAEPWVRRAEFLNADGADTQRMRMWFEALSGNTDTAIALAEEQVQARSRNRRGIYFHSMRIYLQLMYETGRINEALATLEALFPGMLETGETDPQDQYRVAANWGRLYWVIDKGPAQRREVATSLRKLFTNTGVDALDSSAGAMVMLLEGDEASARQALARIIADPTLRFRLWQIIEQRHPLLAPLFESPEVKAVVQEVETKLIQEAARYRELVASGEIIVP